MTTPDSIDSHITATPAVCERVIISLRAHPDGSTRSNISFATGLSRVLVDSALEQMEKRGAAYHVGPHWFARSV